jgi:hypothetical protein
MALRIINITLFFTLIAAAGMSQSSVLSTGKWYKISVEKNGVYRLTFDQLKKMGFDPGKIDPRKIRIYGMAGGMLPQPNSESRPADLVELAIDVRGEADGIFHKQDFILFYAEGPDKVEFNSTNGLHFIEKNLYSDRSYYFFTVSESNGKRIETLDAKTGGIILDSFQDYVFYEKDEYNELKSGREWYGERFELTTDHTFTFNVDGILPDASIHFVSDVMAQSVNTSTFKIYYNEQLVGEQIVPNTPTSTYGIKGRHNGDTFLIYAANVSAHQQARQNIRYNFTRGSSGRSIGFLNKFSFHFNRRLALYGDQTLFRNMNSVDQTVEYHIRNMTLTNEIWNVTNSYEPQAQRFLIENNAARFSAEPNHTNAAAFILFNSKYLSPQLVGTVDNQNLRGLTTPDFIIVSHPAFKAQADRLASHRNRVNQWNTIVVTPEQI